MRPDMPTLPRSMYLQMAPWYQAQAERYGELVLVARSEGDKHPSLARAFDEAAVKYARLAWSYALDSVNWRE